MTILVDDGEMTNNINFFNYTTASLSERGEYNSIVQCDDGTTNGYTSFVFTVTSISGTQQGVVAIGILASLIAASFLFIYIGFKFSESEKLFPIALFFILLSLVTMIYTIQLGYVYNRDMLISSMTTSGHFKIYIGIMYGLIGISFIALLFLILKTLKEFKEGRSVQKYGEGYNKKTGMYEH